MKFQIIMLAVAAVFGLVAFLTWLLSYAPFRCSRLLVSLNQLTISLQALGIRRFSSPWLWCR